MSPRKKQHKNQPRVVGEERIINIKASKNFKIIIVICSTALAALKRDGMRY